MSLARLSSALCLLPLLLGCNDTASTPADAAPERAAQAAASPPSTATPAGAAPLFGTWAADLANCGTFPITISATSFEGAENICAIDSIVDNGDGTFTAALACGGEGETVRESIAMTPVYAPTGEGVILDYLDRGGDPVTVLRCTGS